MTTIVLVTIGIMLAAASALMLNFYGGDAFNTGDAKAQANTLMNAGTNVRTASNLYMVRNGRLPVTPAVLLQSQSLSTMPSLNGAGVQEERFRDFKIDNTRAKKAFVVAGIREDTCKQVNYNVIGGSGSRRVLQTPDGLFGCYKAGGQNLFYAMLSDAAPKTGVKAGITPNCYNPGGGNSNDDAADQACFLTVNIASIVSNAMSTHATEDVEIGGGGMSQGVIQSITYKPNGGLFGPKPYIYFTLNRDVNSNFCARWNTSVRPAGFDTCGNLGMWDHIIYFL